MRRPTPSLRGGADAGPAPRWALNDTESADAGPSTMPAGPADDTWQPESSTVASLVCATGCVDRTVAKRALLASPQPLVDTTLVEVVVARQPAQLVANFELAQAHGATCVPLGEEPLSER